MTDQHREVGRLAADASSQGVGSSSGRRAFLKRGVLVSAPIIISVASKPVWAGNCTLSGMLSGNLSQQQSVCQGGTPDHWGNNAALWPSPYDPGTMVGGTYTGGTLFYNAFSSQRSITLYNNVSMMNIIQSSMTDNSYLLGAHAVAALLNATERTVDVFGYTPDQIKAMWSDLAISDQDLMVMFESLNMRP